MFTSPAVRRGIARVLGGLMAAAAAISLTPAAAPAATRSPDLVVTRATVDRAGISEGGTVRVSHVVKNVGTAKAAPTHSRFYLSTEPGRQPRRPQDQPHQPADGAGGHPAPRCSLRQGAGPGEVAVPGLVELTVPVGTAAGNYTVLACADDRGKVSEKNEAGNCTAAGQKLTVTPAEGSGGLVLQTFADSYGWPDDEDFNAPDDEGLLQLGVPAAGDDAERGSRQRRGVPGGQGGRGALQKLAQSGQADTPSRPHRSSPPSASPTARRGWRWRR